MSCVLIHGSNFKHMKIIIINTIILLLFAVGVTKAQTVVSTNGGTASTTGAQVNWTIGEPITATISDGTTTLTQGFQQSKLTVTAINDIQVAGVEIKVYPNPTSNFVTLHFSKSMEQTSFLLFDLSGKLILQQEIESTDTKINMMSYSGGSYILKLTGSQQPLQSFKIIKR